MATTTPDETTGRTHVGEEARRIVESMRVAVTGSPFVKLRMLVLLVLAIGCVTLAPTPLNVIGVTAMALLTFEMARHK